jgi:hypothetical protein
MPTFEETVERYGLSKAERKFVAGLFDQKKSGRKATYSFRTRSGSSAKTRIGTKTSSGKARKTKGRARKAA